MMKKKRIIFISLLIVGIIVLFVHGKYRFFTTYCHNYYAIVSNTERTIYDVILEVNGEPDEIWREQYTADDTFIYVKYNDGRLFVFSQYKEQHTELRRVELIGQGYRFGKKEIGIGTEKSIVEKAYSKSYETLQKGDRGEYYAEDGSYLVEFYFDEEEKVCKMIIGYADIIHGISGWKEKK